MSVDRKTLTRRYKESPRDMGVGVVRNVRTGKSLVVWGSDIRALLNRQRAQLRLGAHPVKSLQADWNAAGGTAFEFEVVDTLKPSDDPAWDPTSDLRALGELWLEKLDALEPAGYTRGSRTATG